MSRHTLGGMSDLTIQPFDVPPRRESDHHGHDYETESAYIEGE